MNKKELWLRLKEYHFDHVVAPGLWEHITARFGNTHASVKAFTGKIARKHNWKTSFAAKALGEYKKFIYLGIVSDFQVTPSKAIDIVWHEHLLFSKAYREFCTTIIKQPFDHNPELLPMTDQTGVFSVQYLDTLELYKTEFGIEPPVDIWGDPKFDKEQFESTGYQSNKKKSGNDGFSDSYVLYDTAPLHTHFENEPAVSYPEFSGHADHDYGGADSSWGDGSSDSSDSGGDSGGCSGGGSGCGGGD
jgi:hypothetical protein